MSEFDIVYKAFKNYFDSISDVSEIRAFLDEMHSESNVLENLECLSTICEIDSDWVDAINIGIPFVADAVMENRQFVRSDGEVVPIEKVRMVGKDTVVDLSKHSNYITRDPEKTDGRIIPDKLMMPQKDNDFAIYENRFLYSLLVYLSQFIEIRLNEILALTGKYQAKTKIIKKQTSKVRNLSFELTFDETRFNDPLAGQNNGSSTALDTIKQCLNQTKSLLMTPLMKEVSKAPLVKAPIVKTNVFKFDHNFKESLALYNFLQSYTKKGFTVRDISTKISPFVPKTGDDFSSLVYLTSFLTYVHGNKLEAVLKKEYEANEKKRKAEEDRKLLAEIKKIGRNIKESGLSSEEYIMMLQKGQTTLERQILEKDQELKDVKDSIREKVAALDEEFRNDLKEKQAVFDKKVEDKANELALNSLMKVQAYSKEVENLKLEKASSDQEYQKKILLVSSEKKQLEKKAEEEKKQLTTDYEKKLSDVNEKNSAIQKEQNSQIEELKKQLSALKEENVLLQGKVDNLRNMNGLPSERDMTEKGNFDSLEKEKEAFDKYFEKTWKDTKKRIRKETLKINKEQLKEEVKEKKNEKKLKKETKKSDKKEVKEKTSDKE